MDVTVHLRNLRSAPRKTRLVADLIRQKPLAKAKALLEFSVNRPGRPLLKLLNAAAAAAVNDRKLDESRLYVSKITVDQGPMLKRSFPMSRGRAYPIMKRTSHITLVLSETQSGKNPTNYESKRITNTKRNIRNSLNS